MSRRLDMLSRLRRRYFELIFNFPSSSCSERAEGMRQRQKRWRSVLFSRHGIETAGASTWQARAGHQRYSPENASGVGSARKQVPQWVTPPFSDFADKGKCIVLYVPLSSLLSFSFIPKNRIKGKRENKALFMIEGTRGTVKYSESRTLKFITRKYLREIFIISSK